jgi:hypothetical protein
MENQKALSAEQSLPPRTELSAHTPGPWEIDTRIGLRIWGNPGRVCTIPLGDCKTVQKMREADANAKLIAAAPDLLAALIKCADNLAAEIEARASIVQHPAMLHQYELDMIPVKAARAAIAKATGAA